MGNSLCLHCGASNVERSAVYDVETPEPSGRHFPIAHATLLEVVENNLKLNGFEVVGEAHALTAEGMRYFGLIEVKKSVPCMDEPSPGGVWDYARKVANDHGLIVGLRNAHDKSFCAALVCGDRVFVCDNLSFSGEVLVGRMHTRHIERDLPILVPRAFEALGRERVRMDERIEAYKGAAIDDAKAHDLIVRSLVDERIFPVSSLPDVVKEWREPRHDEFEPRTVWSLFNGYTEVAKPAEGKAGNLHRLAKRTSTLYGFFDRELGLSLDARLAEGCDDVVTTNDALAR